MEDVPYTRVLRVAWIWILAAALLGSLLAFGVAKVLPRTYVATSTLMLKDESSSASLFEQTQFSQARVKSYPSFIASSDVVEGVREELGLDDADYTDREIQTMLSATSLPDTSIVEVSASAPTPTMAADLANAASTQMSRVIEAFEDASAGTSQTVKLIQIKVATPPSDVASPQTIPIVGLGLLTGLAVGAIVALLRSGGSMRTVAPEDVRRRVGLPLVGETPKKTSTPPTKQQKHMYLEAASNLLALAGGHDTAFALVPTQPDPLDAAVLDGLSDGFADVGHPTIVLDARARKDADLPVLQLQDLLRNSAEEPLAGRGSFKGHYAVANSWADPSSPTLGKLVEDITGKGFAVLLVVDANASTTIAGLGIPLLVVVRDRKTKLTDLIMVASRLKALGVKPLGVLMTGTRKLSNSVASSWKEPGATPKDPGRARGNGDRRGRGA